MLTQNTWCLLQYHFFNSPHQISALQFSSILTLPRVTVWLHRIKGSVPHDGPHFRCQLQVQGLHVTCTSVRPGEGQGLWIYDNSESESSLCCSFLMLCGHLLLLLEVSREDKAASVFFWVFVSRLEWMPFLFLLSHLPFYLPTCLHFFFLSCFCMPEDKSCHGVFL